MPDGLKQIANPASVLSAQQRAADHLTQLTPEEKIAQLGGWIMPYALRSGANPELDDAMKTAFANGLGTISYVNMGHPPTMGVAWMTALQRHLVENMRVVDVDIELPTDSLYVAPE